MYNAFISYSHAADGMLAPALEKGLQRFGLPWWKRRVLNVFRDESSLSVSPHLWANIEKALSESEYLIYMASPKSTESKWVGKEIEYWIENKSIDTLLIALTDGEIIWNDTKKEFKETENNSLPDILKNKFQEEPFYIDLRPLKNKTDLSLSNPLFQKELLKLAAQLHGKAPKDLASEELKAQRRWKLIRNSAFILLIGLLGFSVYQTVEAIKNKNEAIEQTVIARTQAKKAIASSLNASSNLLNQTDATVSFRLAEYSLKYDSTITEAYSALLRAFYSNPHYYLGELHGNSFYDAQAQPMKYLKPSSEFEYTPPDIRVSERFLIKNGIRQMSEFLLLSRTILSPHKDFGLFYYIPETDNAEYMVELWDLKDRFTRLGRNRWNEETQDWYNDPLYQQYLSYNQVDGLDDLNFSFDNRYLVLPKDNKANIISLPFIEQEYLGRNFDTYTPLEFQISSSSSQLIRANYSSSEHIVSTIDLKGDTVSFHLQKMPLLTIPFDSKTTFYSDSSGSYVLAEYSSTTTIWNLIGENLGTGKIIQGVFVPNSKDKSALKDLKVIPLLDSKYSNSYGFEEDIIAYSNDGALKINGSTVYDSLGSEVVSLEGHAEIISSVDISDFGEFYLTATCPKVGTPETKLWDSKGNELLTIKKFGGKVGFLPGSKAFYTYTISCCAECDSDPRLIIWPIEIKLLINWVNQNQFHELSDLEMLQFGIDTLLLKEN
ncbi:MAG: toll/interleukin-1 receptor domain-containing protein [Algoriphagus sp.]|uniref:toll/interleukin-1 receptor domain-containing protein n=1 Tax=Algoriphagus sp. TaxID=1872435 RepID=UPI0026229BF5|nr:toll/interleukin-1 receptor domain-containing protein [Algoriphagus sp.]MDG1278530.1 toll/interleukin-1 receptor domain-containing protein [Algoriphagus sp.]